MLMSLLPNRNTINKPKTRRTQSEPPEESKPTVALSTMDQFSADTVSIILSLKEKEKKLRVQLAVLLLSLTPRKLLQRKQFSLLLPNREDSRCRAMLMSLPLNRNIINKQKTIRTESELPDESKLTEVLFTMDQFSQDTVFIILSLKERKRKLRVQLVELLLSLILKKLLPRKQSSLLSLHRDNSSKKVMLMSLLPNRNTINKPKTRRTQSEPPEESKPTAVSSTIHQFSADTVFITPFHKVREKRKPKKTLLSNTLLPNPTNKRKNLLNKSSRLSKSKETSK